MKTLLFLLLGLIIIGILTIVIYLHHELPQYEGTLSLPGLEDTVEVYTDSYAVPHVFARNDRDLFYAAGYISARERLFQMTTIASAARGELSLLFGEGTLADDIYLRTWGIPSVAKRMVETMDLETKSLVAKFCAGINARIDELGKNFPLEFKLLRVKPVKWTAEDVAGYARLMGHDLQQSWKPEILFGAVHEYFGEDKLRELLPAYDGSRPTIVAHAPTGLYNDLFSILWERESSIRNLTGSNGAAIGSNSWVISGKRSATGESILANDPHLGFTQPAKWYEIHLKGGRFNVSGVCLAGIPIPIIGQNKSCAWGFTNVMADDIDFFVETVNPDNPNQYLSGDQWLDMDIVEERIPLKNGRDTILVIRSTHHGPIISDIHPLLRNGKKVVSMSWTGHQATDEITALFKLAQIKNWEDFSIAVRMFAVPGQNMVYADAAGNIGWRPAVKIPLRKEGESLLPRPGHDPEYDWKGYIPFDEMPFLYNPERGVIVTANNKTIGPEYPNYISNLWADPSRAQRINKRIDQQEKISIEEVKDIQNDLVSPYSQELMPYIVNAALGNEQGNLKHAITLLREWNGRESAESAAALVFHVTLVRLLHNIYKDELDLIGDHMFEAYTHFPMIPHRNLLGSIKGGSSSWFDDVTTPDYVETRDEIIHKSLREAVLEIEKTIGTNPTSWAWGKVHTLAHPHSLGIVKFFDWLFDFNVGPFPAGGSSNTINNGEYDIMNPYHQIVGPSMRRIVDFSNLDHTQMVIPTGQSGLSNSPHYQDQAALYNRGKYRTTYFDEETIRQSEDFNRLVLLPQ